MDIDAGPIIFNLSPSGTAFTIGCATCFGDKEFRKQLLKNLRKACEGKMVGGLEEK